MLGIPQVFILVGLELYKQVFLQASHQLLEYNRDLFRRPH
jgi:hypothetical protein